MELKHQYQSPKVFRYKPIYAGIVDDNFIDHSEEKALEISEKISDKLIEIIKKQFAETDNKAEQENK